MEFGPSLTHPLLQTVVQIGEATIRHACAGPESLRIEADLDRLPDGREGVRVRLTVPQESGEFVMLLRNYFDLRTLHRVAAHAWNRRGARGARVTAGVSNN